MANTVRGTSHYSQTHLAIDENVLDSFLLLPRNTASAAGARRNGYAQGPLQTIFSSFAAPVQRALRQLCFERMTMEARFRANMERLERTDQSSVHRTTDVLQSIAAA